jgi:prolyl oligopeptidase
LRTEALDILGAENRLPHSSFTANGLLYFWQDAGHPKGVLRRTTLESYRSDNPKWEPVLDLDALNE